MEEQDREVFKRHIPIEELIEKMKTNRIDDIIQGFCRVKNDSIILDYACFKCFAGNDTYQTVLNIITGHIDSILRDNDTFAVHVNMKHLTISDVDKHKKFISVLSNQFKERYPSKLKKCHIYNAPSVFSQIFKIISCFIDKETQKKIHLHNY